MNRGAAFTRHTAWCAGGHRCNLGEHRAAPVTFTAPTGRAVLTRVQSTTGTHYAEVWLRLALPVDEPAARERLAVILAQLRALLAATAVPGGTQ